MNIFRVALVALVALLAFTGSVATASPEERETEVQAFVAEMARKHGFDRSELMQLMGRARFRHDIIRAITRPAESKPWYEYRGIFLTRSRTEGGARFWKDHAPLLERAEREFGVAPEVIVAILGVETRYGQHTGKYRVLDALTTLAFGYPKRAEFFRKQLEEFLLLSREEGIELEQAEGSYAGAMGLPQFIPSSYREYAVDFDGDGRRDLWNSDADAIGSVANYFKRHGWQQGGTVAVRANAGGGKDLEPLVQAGMKPSLTMDQLLDNGVKSESVIPQGALASLVKLENRGGDEYWLGLNNFYVITRYNHSNLYAMAVYQLSREILELHEAARDDLVSRHEPGHGAS